MVLPVINLRIKNERMLRVCQSGEFRTPEGNAAMLNTYNFRRFQRLLNMSRRCRLCRWSENLQVGISRPFWFQWKNRFAKNEITNKHANDST